ncbi:hypothetical protein ACFY0G_24555 [Streptomyces sp. NPDC001552]|uniref:hypothetical protein n=1 Tax=Streptomyces sp. NPDC001552 TaxID=3364587 RepID=UPI0036C1BB43
MCRGVEPHLGERHAEECFEHGLLPWMRERRGCLALPPPQLPDAHRRGNAEANGFLPEHLDE